MWPKRNVAAFAAVHEEVHQGRNVHDDQGYDEAPLAGRSGDHSHGNREFHIAQSQGFFAQGQTKKVDDCEDDHGNSGAGEPGECWGCAACPQLVER